MALKFVYGVLSGLTLLYLNEAVTVLNKNCATSEEQARLEENDFSDECKSAYMQLDFTSAESVLTTPIDPSVFDTLCTDKICFQALMSILEMCYNSNDGLIDLFKGGCSFNSDDELCHTATYNSLLKPDSWQVKARAECFENFDFETYPLANASMTTISPVCSDDCRAAVEQARDELGCCLNSIYNNTFGDDYLPFASYELWSSCGVQATAPDSCASRILHIQDCIKSEEEARLQMDDFSEECKSAYKEIDFTTVETILTRGLDPSVFEVLCKDKICFEAFMDILDMCYTSNDGLIDLFKGGCSFNSDTDEICYIETYNSLQKPDSWQVKAREECFENLQFDTNPLANVDTNLLPVCSDDCRAAVEQARDELGCCLNSVYNNTYADDHLPFASYELWSKCGIEDTAPDSCKARILNIQDCIKSEEEARLQMDDFSEECKSAYKEIDFTTVETILTRGLDPSVFEVLCKDEICFEAFMDILDMCYTSNDGLIDLFKGGCSFNSDTDEICYIETYNSLQKPDSWQVKARAECFENLDFETNPLANVDTNLLPVCSDDCRAAVEQARDELGCCLNSVYNNTYADDHLPFASYELWSKCGIEDTAPEFCSSATAVVTSALCVGIYVFLGMLGSTI